jgi:hypothetical protein
LRHDVNLEVSDRTILAVACGWLFVAVLSMADFGNPGAAFVFVCVASLAMLLLVLVTRVPARVVLLFVLACGIVIRCSLPVVTASDVLAATQEALNGLFSGINPYTHVFTSTHPPGSPFPYLPGELAYYAIQLGIAGNLLQYDRFAGLAILVAIAASAPLLRPSVGTLPVVFYATSVHAINRARDGSNDTALALLVVLSIVALAYATRSAEHAPRRALALIVVSALFFGWAVAFKAFAWLFFPFVVRFLEPRRRWIYCGIALGFALALTLPLAALAPPAFAGSIASGLTFHSTVYGFNVWSGLASTFPYFAQPPGIVAGVVMAVGAVGAFVLLWRQRARTLGEALFHATIVFAVVVLLARFSPESYYAFLAAMLAASSATFTVRARASA